jgi:hypothetical protein
MTRTSPEALRVKTSGLAVVAPGTVTVVMTFSLFYGTRIHVGFILRPLIAWSTKGDQLFSIDDLPEQTEDHKWKDILAIHLLS